MKVTPLSAAAIVFVLGLIAAGETQWSIVLAASTSLAVIAAFIVWGADRWKSKK